jgi:hypothetical protein
MSAWDNFKNGAKKAFNGAKSGVTKGGAIGALGGAVLGKDGLNDLLMGKKSKDIKPDAIANEIRATQSMGLKELNNALNNTNGADVVRQGAAQNVKGVLSAAQDARRNAQKLMAQRGLQGSSLGLSSQRSIDQQSGRDIASINAQIPGQIRNQQIQDATTRINAGGINTNGMNFNKIEGSRSGGLLGYASALAPLAGTIGGAMAGGPQGAAMGSQMGQGVGSVLATRPDRAGGRTSYSHDYLNGNTGGY